MERVDSARTVPLGVQSDCVIQLVVRLFLVHLLNMWYGFWEHLPHSLLEYFVFKQSCDPLIDDLILEDSGRVGNSSEQSICE